MVCVVFGTLVGSIDPSCIFAIQSVHSLFGYMKCPLNALFSHEAFAFCSTTTHCLSPYGKYGWLHALQDWLL